MMRRVSWEVSEATRLTIIEEYIRGDPVVEIARRHEVSETYVWQVRTAAGVPSRHPWHEVPSDRKDAALAAYLSGVKMEAIEAEFGITRNTIYTLTEHRRRVSSTKGKQVRRKTEIEK